MVNVQQGIGYMDSGVGGLTVVKEALRQLPNEQVIFIGDTARNPYGPRPASQVKEFTWQMTNFLLSKHVKMIVIACNTATAAALPEIQAALDIPVIGVIVAGSQAAIKATKNKKVGVIGTIGTIKSQAYPQAIARQAPQVEVTGVACPKFVPLVESDEYKSAVAKKVVAESLTPFDNQHIDTLILGCTHYPLIRHLIQNRIGDQVTLIDSGAETVNQLSALLEFDQLAAPARQPQHEFYTTGNPEMFQRIAGDWLELNDLDVRHIDLTELIKHSEVKHAKKS
ncbi:glutamate racemase [Loigolactobacillus coryniformis]|jgi:glutamate racemase|uniref:glutamate racemase n=1 Tax=Loigolactobacillus coryniformis TaxID=1610 RepID=UPI001C5E1F73|nr:glutamate racemase [Loigolactobacillus coryniformis]MBW4802919.1 glutamate racemase [Loigolactobacillus coryniformis subsp. torquens]MBW4805615.1 glutamate racemase [Loigolactobacillus coryniformis subsp. torquens]MDC4185134.1 glutamate racemase [Loigolactobacillus coryniformis]MDT3392129.1 glutamate racemase [Bacillota bacterium]